MTARVMYISGNRTRVSGTQSISELVVSGTQGTSGNRTCSKRDPQCISVNITRCKWDSMYFRCTYQRFKSFYFGDTVVTEVELIKVRELLQSFYLRDSVTL